jgi:hypothetical protein
MSAGASKESRVVQFFLVLARAFRQVLATLLRLGLHAVLAALSRLITARLIATLGRGLVTLCRTLITLRHALAGRLALFGLLFSLLLGLHSTAVVLALGLHVAALLLVFGTLISFSAYRLLLGLRGLDVRLTAAMALHCARRRAAALG